MTQLASEKIYCCANLLTCNCDIYRNHTLVLFQGWLASVGKELNAFIFLNTIHPPPASFIYPAPSLPIL